MATFYGISLGTILLITSGTITALLILAGVIMWKKVKEQGKEEKKKKSREKTKKPNYKKNPEKENIEKTIDSVKNFSEKCLKNYDYRNRKNFWALFLHDFLFNKTGVFGEKVERELGTKFYTKNNLTYYDNHNLKEFFEKELKEKIHNNHERHLANMEKTEMTTKYDEELLKKIREKNINDSRIKTMARKTKMDEKSWEDTTNPEIVINYIDYCFQVLCKFVHEKLDFLVKTDIRDNYITRYKPLKTNNKYFNFYAFIKKYSEHPDLITGYYYKNLANNSSEYEKIRSVCEEKMKEMDKNLEGFKDILFRDENCFFENFNKVTSIPKTLTDYWEAVWIIIEENSIKKEFYKEIKKKEISEESKVSDYDFSEERDEKIRNALDARKEEIRQEWEKIRKVFIKNSGEFEELINKNRNVSDEEIEKIAQKQLRKYLTDKKIVREEEKQEYCVYCGDKISSSDNHCPNCNKPLLTGYEKRIVEDKPRIIFLHADNTRHCPYCGNILHTPHPGYCEGCNKPLISEFNDLPENEEEEKTRNDWTRIINEEFNEGISFIIKKSAEKKTVFEPEKNRIVIEYDEPINSEGIRTLVLEAKQEKEFKTNEENIIKTINKLESEKK